MASGIPAISQSRRRARRPALACLLAWAAALFGPGPAAAAQATGMSELETKAQFVLELPSFVKFPRPRSAAQPFTVVVLGDCGFLEALKRGARGRSVQGRPVQLLQLPNLLSAEACDLIFISRSEWPRVPAILAWAKDKGILTVVEGEQPAVREVMVHLLVEGSFLKLGLNQAALEKEGFTISAQLLSVARILARARALAGTPRTATAAPLPPS